MGVAEQFTKYGLNGYVRKAIRIARNHARSYKDAWRFRDAPRYLNPSADELAQIERKFSELGIVATDYCPSPEQFQKFKKDAYFPEHYFGGQNSKVRDEKMLEHWIAADLLGLWDWCPEDVYIDIAASRSPWVKILRERFGLSAFAIDMEPVRPDYRNLSYYRTENATESSFEDASVRGASLQCAYEMFLGQDDQLLIKELIRILKPGGNAVILPLYMHTHYCAYSTPEYYGKGYPDPSAKEYIRMDCYGIPSSRKYDVHHLKERVLEPIQQANMRYCLYVLRNKKDLGHNIYCHFILKIQK